MKKRDLILAYVKEESERFFTEANKEDTNLPTAASVSTALNILRNNASQELNNLAKAGLLIKILGRPVQFLHRAIAKNFMDNLKNQYSSFHSFLAEAHTPPTPPPKNKALRPFSEDVFSKFIGHEEDLNQQIKQAKAAIIYPPKGLNVILTGATGTGKSYFASLMAEYAKVKGILAQNGKFIVFNCADYAENKQLLMAKLFGYKKGAFTGAQKDTLGMVDLAHGGILFLDEIHRLPPEGQEMLFSILDHGKFMPLGENEKFRQAQFILIGATTENTDDYILKTFMRRIPMSIHLPALNQRSMATRLKLINHFFQEEALRIGKIIEVEKAVIKVLLLYNCKGNVGQLKNDIKMICANSFIENVIANKKKITVKLHQIMADLDDKFALEKSQQGFHKEFFEMEEKLIYHFEENKQSHYSSFNMESGNVYTVLLDEIKAYLAKGYSFDKIKNGLDLKFTQRHTSVVDKLIVSKLVTTDVKILVEKHLAKYVANLPKDEGYKIIYSIALHVESMISRIIKGQPYSYKSVEEENIPYEMEYAVAEGLIKDVQQRFHLHISPEEIKFIALFLYSVSNLKNDEHIPILILSHGENIGKNMAKVAKELLGLNNIYYVDMPLAETVQNTLNKVKNMVSNLYRAKGILILADMGSLTSFGEYLQENLGIKTATIKMVSTPMVIEAARRSHTPKITLEELKEAVLKSSDYIGERISLPEVKEKVETANKLEETIANILAETLVFLNSSKVQSLLNTVFNALVAQQVAVKDEVLMVKFFFHCSFMLERCIKGETLPKKQKTKLIKAQAKVYKILRQEFKLCEEALGMSIPDEELAWLLELFGETSRISV